MTPATLAASCAAPHHLPGHVYGATPTRAQSLLIAHVLRRLSEVPYPRWRSWP